MVISDNTATAAQPAIQVAQWNEGTQTISGNDIETSHATKAALRIYAIERDPIFAIEDNNIHDSVHGIQIGHGDPGKSEDLSQADYSYSGNTFTNIEGHELVIYLPTEATAEQIAEMAEDFRQVYNPGVYVQEINGVDPFTYVVDNAPNAVEDAYTAFEDSQLVVEAAQGVLANDTDPENNVLSAVLVDTTTKGTLALNADGSFTYMPGLDFNGTDTFTYKAVSGSTESLPTTVTITVTPVKDPVQAVDDSYSVDEDAVLEVAVPGVLGNDIDVDLNNQRAVLVTNVTNGTLVLRGDGSFTYTPKPDFNGEDSFVYELVTYPRINAEDPWTDTATVTITVNPVDDPALEAGQFIYDEHTNPNGQVLGISTSWTMIESSVDDAISIVIEMFAGEDGDVLLQTNTANMDLFTGFYRFTSPFDIFGDFDYTADGYWANVREAEYGQTVEPTHVVATITLEDGTVLVAHNWNLTGTRETIMIGDMEVATFHYRNAETTRGTLMGVSTDLRLIDRVAGDIASLVIELQAGDNGETLLQTNTLNVERVAGATSGSITSPFNIFGDYDYTGSSWNNVREAEYGQSVAPTCIEATITYTNGKVIVDQLCTITGDPGTILPSVEAQDFTYGAWADILGINAGFQTVNFHLGMAENVKVELFAGEVGAYQLLQTNTWIAENPAWDGTTIYSAPFDIYGTFDYAADGYWTNLREAEFGQMATPTRVLTTITLPGGVVVTAENTNLTGDPAIIEPSLTVQDFYYASSATMKGVSADVRINNGTTDLAESIVVQIFTGTDGNYQLLQTNTANMERFNAFDVFTSPFDIFGTRNYEGTSWANAREPEYGQTLPVTRVLATLTMPSGKVLTAERTILTGDRNTILPSVVAQDFTYGAWADILGINAGFQTVNFDLGQAVDVKVELFAGEAGAYELLQTNTWIAENPAWDGMTTYSAPFDIFGTFDYAADGYWTNVRQVEYGQTAIPTRVLTTITLPGGVVVTAENTNLTGDRETIILGDMEVATFHYRNAETTRGTLVGVSTDLRLIDMVAGDIASLVIELQAGANGEILLQTNTLNVERVAGSTSDSITSPFNIYGDYDYTGSSWNNIREGEYGQTVAPTCVEATITYTNGKVVVDQLCTITGDPGTIEPSVVAGDFGYMAFSDVLGVTAGFQTVNFDLSQAIDVKVELFTGEVGAYQLLQTNTAILEGGLFDGVSSYSSPFDIFGTFDYTADGYWVNVRQAEYGQTAIPTRVLTTITLPGGVVVTAENTMLTGDRRTIVSTLDQEIADAPSYVYDPAYEYVGDMEFDAESNTYTLTYWPAEYLAGQPMNDLARYLGALYRQEGSTVESIVYDGVTYTWDETGTLVGSNWEDASGNTLVSAIVADLVGVIPGTATVTLSDGINTADVTFVVDVYNTLDAEIESAPAYVYDPAYTYVGTREFDADTNTYTLTYTDDNLVPGAMNDLARYLGALYRQADATIIGITYKGVDYTWDAEGTLAGSNWKNADGQTLVSIITADFLNGDIDAETGLSLIVTDGIHTETVTFLLVIQDTTAPVIETVTAIGAEGFEDVVAVENVLTVDQGYTVAQTEIVLNEAVTVEEGTVVSLGGVPYGSITADGAKLIVVPFAGNEVANLPGTFEFSIPAGSVKDLNGNALEELTLTLIVNNVAPVAVADTYTAEEDIALVVAAPGVLENDVDWTDLTAILVDGPANGSVTLNADGSFSYLGDENWYGTDSFTYKASDGELESEVVTVTITVTDVKDQVNAVDDEYSTDEDVTLTVDAENGVLANDIDVDENTQRAVLVTDVAHGDLTLNADGSFVYIPDADWYGTDTFVYELVTFPAIQSLWTDTATVTITVTPVLDAPTLSTDLPASVFEGVETEYGVTLENPANGDAFTGVRVQFKLTDTDLADIATLEYFETTTQTWMDLPLTQEGTDVVGWFGPAAGFPMPAPYSATSQFRLTMADGSAGT